MIRRRVTHHAPLVLLGLVVAACSDSGAPVSAPDAPDLSRSDQGAPLYIVTFRDDVRDVRGAAAAIARGRGLGVQGIREHAARGFNARMTPAQAAELRADPRVLIVEADKIMTLDLPREAARPGGGGGGGEQTPWGITRVGGAGDGTGKTAWILDTGIDLDHPDLNTSRSCHTYFAGTSPDDGNGHGTHVAGTVAAKKGNGIGVVGVAANAYVCSVRVLGNSGSGSYSGIIAGVNYVAANGRSGDVANMSLGGTGTNATLEKAVSDASTSVKFVLAAGNSGANANNFTPARVNGPNIYTISAVNSSDCMASWSNYGNPPVDYAAPGVGILSTYRGGGTKSLSGTSMAAPHVAGILLLGAVKSDGVASCDRDGTADPIAHR